MLSYDVVEPFKSGGMPEEKARRAADALPGAAQASEGVDLKSSQRLHTWMIGATIAMNVAILVRLVVQA